MKDFMNVRPSIKMDMDDACTHLARAIDEMTDQVMSVGSGIKITEEIDVLEFMHKALVLALRARNNIEPA